MISPKRRRPSHNRQPEQTRRQCKLAPIKAAPRVACRSARRTVSRAAGNLFAMSIGLAIGDILEELAPCGLIGPKKRTRLPDAWLVRRPANFEWLVGAAPNRCCPVTEG
jgi:hypothetical protein